MEPDLDIHVVEASDVQARIEVTYTNERFANADLSGTITGPRREGSRTLPATVEFDSVRRGSMPAVEAILPDPCFWSAEFPFLYDMSFELRREEELLDTAKFSIALHAGKVVKR